VEENVCQMRLAKDTGHAVLEYGYNPRPQILIAKNKDSNKTSNILRIFKACAAGVLEQ